jgi:hypothetical protein
MSKPASVKSMIWRGVRGSTSTWIAVALAVTVVVAVFVVIAEFWSGIGDSEISVAGWLAMGLGILVTLALGIGLMSLVFFSSRSGYDETSGRDS